MDHFQGSMFEMKSVEMWIEEGGRAGKAKVTTAGVFIDGGVKFSSEQREHRWDEVLWSRCFSPRIVISSTAGPRVAKERKTKPGRSEIQTAVERAFPSPTHGALSMMSRNARALLKVKRSAASRSTLSWFLFSCAFRSYQR